MSDFDTWWKENYEGIAYILKDDARDCWNASRAALIGEVKPVAWCLRYNDPRFGPIHSNPSMCKPELEEMECVTSGRVSVENLFTAEAIATAHAKGREEGFQVAVKALSDNMENIIAAAIEKLLGEKK